MTNLMILEAQKFINTTYNRGVTIGTSAVTEDGNSTWETMFALTRALQYELGITSLSDSFGPSTLSILESKFPTINNTENIPINIIKIIQSGLHCKGYNGGKIDGIYSKEVQDSVLNIKNDMGLSEIFPGSGIEAKIVKGLLNMDSYTLASNGDLSIRQVEQWLNKSYIARKNFQVIPTEGINSRTVAQSMLFAIQYESGMTDEIANGVFGPGTQGSIKNHVLEVGSTGIWSRLFTAAMILNKYFVTFGDYTEEVADAVSKFQKFASLPVTGKADFATWSSLLVSHGDKSRAGSACDGVTKITAPRAQALYAAGYRYIGRYLYNPSTKNLLEKQIQPGELDVISSHGLSCFPIYQTYNDSVDYFTSQQGADDAKNAIFWAKKFGFKKETVIYFAVDYDALDQEISSHILPYFQAINIFISENSEYKVGVYGSRNICQRIFSEGLSQTSFVADMSSGYSGNSGYPLPENWAFDQIDTVHIGEGESFIEIDKNVASGIDLGQNTFDSSVE